MSDEEKARLDDHKARERRRILKAEYGTDDEVECARIKSERDAKLAQADALIAAEADRKRASMSEVEVLTADKTRLEARVTELEAELKGLKQKATAQQQDAKLRQIAAPLIKPNRIKHALLEFGEYVSKLTPSQIKLIDDKRTAAWFSKFAKDNPDMALEAAPAPTAPVVAPTPGTPPAPVAAPLARKPVPAGARPVGAPPAPRQLPTVDPLAGKTARPGLPNSMNAAELRVFAKRNGVNLR